MQRRFSKATSISFLSKHKQRLDNFLRYAVLRPVIRNWLCGGGYLRLTDGWLARLPVGMRPEQFIWPFQKKKTNKVIKALHKGMTSHDEYKARVQRAIAKEEMQRKKKAIAAIIQSLLHR